MDIVKTRIGDCITCNPSVKLDKGQTYPVIDIDKIVVGRRYVTNKENVTFGGQSGSRFENGDTLMARITPCLENGKIAQAKIQGKGLGSTELFVFRGKEGVTDNDFVYYFFKQNFIRNLAANSMTGASGRQRADMKFIKKIQIDLPELPVQRRIASILSAYDNLIENNTRRIRLLEQMAENIYKEWFVRFRFPGHENAEFENGLPKGWKEYSIKELCDINNQTLSSKDKSKVIEYLDTSSITCNQISGTECFTVDAAPSRARRIVKDNSIVFSTVRPNLKHYGILKGIPDNMIVSTGFAVFDAKYDMANIIFLFLSTQDVVDYCQSIAEGAVATYPSIKAEEIGRLRIALPEKTIAEKWNKKFEAIYIEMLNLQRQSNLLARQRDLLLPRLMSGKLEVKG